MISTCVSRTERHRRARADDAQDDRSSWLSSILVPDCRDSTKFFRPWELDADNSPVVGQDDQLPAARHARDAANATGGRRQIRPQWSPPNGAGASRFPHPEPGSPSIPFPGIDVTALRNSTFTNGPGAVMFDELVAGKLFHRALQPTSITPFFIAAERTPKPDEVTITTHVTMDRIEVFMALVARNQGPISCALHIDDYEHAHGALEFVRELRTASPLMQRHVDVHIVRDPYERQYNLLRNVARFFARTDYFMLLDVDFSIRTDVQRALADALHEDSPCAETIRSGEAALVFPAFEYADPAVEPPLTDPVTHEPGVQELIIEAARTRFNGTFVKLGTAPPKPSRARSAVARRLVESRDMFFPTTKEDLMRQIDTGRIIVFHAMWPRGHFATDYPRWYESTGPYVVTEYEATYEPYVIARKDAVPWCEERFVGYGANKASCIMQMYISGVSFWVSPIAFVMHQAHGYPEGNRKNERPQNRRLYDQFFKENCVAKAREFVAAGLWHSPRAFNLRRHCGRVLKGLGELLELNRA